jgi:hypothetical protein
MVLVFPFSTIFPMLIFHLTMMVEIVGCSNMLVIIYQTALHHIPTTVIFNLNGQTTLSLDKNRTEP